MSIVKPNIEPENPKQVLDFLQNILNEGATIKANIPNEVDFSKGIHNLNIIFKNLEELK